MTDEEYQQVADEVRDECAKIASLEYRYWSRVDNERIQEICIGASGAAANICAAILMGKTADDQEREIEARKK